MRFIPVILLLFAFSSCCSLDEVKYRAFQVSVRDVRESHDLLLPKYLEMIEKDASLDADDKDDEKKFVESIRRLDERMKKAVDNLKPED